MGQDLHALCRPNPPGSQVLSSPESWLPSTHLFSERANCWGAALRAPPCLGSERLGGASSSHPMDLAWCWQQEADCKMGRKRKEEMNSPGVPGVWGQGCRSSLPFPGPWGCPPPRPAHPVLSGDPSAAGSMSKCGVGILLLLFSLGLFITRGLVPRAASRWYVPGLGLPNCETRSCWPERWVASGTCQALGLPCRGTWS